MKGKQDEVRIPDIEVIINAAGSDVAVICFYRGNTIHDDFEIVAGISDPSDVPNLVTTLEVAIKTLRTNDWHSLDELDTRSVSDESKAPF